MRLLHQQGVGGPVLAASGGRMLASLLLLLPVTLAANHSVCESRCTSPHSERSGATRTWDCPPLSTGDWEPPRCDPSGSCTSDRPNVECEYGQHKNKSTLCPHISTGLPRAADCEERCRFCTTRALCNFYCEGIAPWETASGVTCIGPRERISFCPRPQHEIDTRLNHWFVAALALIAFGWLLPMLVHGLMQRFFPTINLAQLVSSVPEVAALAASRMQHRLQIDARAEEGSVRTRRSRTSRFFFGRSSKPSLRDLTRGVGKQELSMASENAAATLAAAVLARRRLQMRIRIVAQVGWMLACISPDLPPFHDLP